MLVSLGKRTTAETLVELLLECHQRIRKFTQLAMEVGSVPSLDAPSVIEATSRVERYFAVALPLHVADEEQSVLPRLYGRSTELDAQLCAMQEEHLAHQPLLADLQSALGVVRNAPAELTHRDTLRTCASQLYKTWESHLAREEAVIFPALSELLSPEIQRLIVDELRARRRTP